MIARFRLIGFSSAIIILAIFSTIFGQVDSKKNAVPTASSQSEVRKLVKEIFEDEYAKANSPSTSLALAQKLFQQAKETKDDVVSKYVLLREAQQAAVNAADSNYVLQVIDEIDTFFEIEALSEKIDALDGIQKTAKVRDQQAALAQSAASLLEIVARKEDFKAAEKLSEIAYNMARRSRDRDLTKVIKARIDYVKDAETAYDKMKIAMKTLEERPDDPGANLIAGRYLSLKKGKWDQGLPMLAKSRDTDFSELAKLEISAPKTAESRVELADQWWKLAETFDDEIQEQYQIKVHAAVWYRKALPDLTGIHKLRVEQRLEELKQVATLVAGDPTTSDKSQIIELSSADGTKFEIQDDTSFFVSGTNPNSADYSIQIRIGRQPVLGFRLDALTDDRLPKGGPGRHVNGNYILTGVQVSLADPNGEFTIKVPVIGAEADYAQPGFDVTRAIDGSDQTGWSVGPQVGKPHWAAFRFEGPVKSESLMKVVLLQRNPSSYNIGRFRILALTQNGWEVVPEKPSRKQE